MVSSVTTDGSFTPSNANTSNSSNNMSQNTSPSTTQELDAIRVAIIRNKLESQHLNKHAVSDLLRQRLAPTATNKGYRKNQLRFLEWAQQHKVSFTAFSGVDLVNFLADIRQSHGLQVATLKTTFFFLLFFVGFVFYVCFVVSNGRNTNTMATIPEAKVTAVVREEEAQERLCWKAKILEEK
ncbi:hypothetical protein G6F62_012917 [Rhizopus arrhizus]|nr:hypothetical protein G6F62_012917 [Rhizopus arrhizus]